MTTGRGVASPEHVAEQYTTSQRFDARVRLWERFSTNPTPLLRWIFDGLALPTEGRALDIGAGTGNLWRENLEQLPDDLEIVLADQSPGMLAEARERLGQSGGRFAFEQADVQDMPFEDERFDVVVANHMLYHVPDRERALDELRRVLARDGRLYIVTNAWNHLAELREWCERFDVPTELRGPGRRPEFFDEEEAARSIGSRLPELRVRRYTNTLAVTELDPLVDYVLSMCPGDASEHPGVQAFAEFAGQQISLAGALHISGVVASFEAQKTGA